MAKGRWGTVIQAAIASAHTKGLQVRKNQFGNGWCITLPNGSRHDAASDSDMVKYVRGY